MMENQIKDAQWQGQLDHNPNEFQGEIEFSISSGHVLDDIQYQSQRANQPYSSARKPSSLPMKPQSDSSFSASSTGSGTMPEENVAKQQQDQHGTYFASALPALALQHAAKLVVNGNSQQQQFNENVERNFAGQVYTSSSPVLQYNGIRPSPAPMNQCSIPSTKTPISSSTPNISTPLPITPIVTSSPSSSLASAARLASMGVAFGPGVNPNISNTPSTLGGVGGSSVTSNGMNVINQNNPPIVNTGNNGPMCVQPGDWVCSKCGFVNWRRRRVCMRCYPLADQNNEMSRSIVNGAALAAQLAAGIEPSAELMASLTPTRRLQTVQATPKSIISPFQQQQHHSTMNLVNNEMNYNPSLNSFTSPSSSPSRTASSSPILSTYQQNGIKSNQDEIENSLTRSLQNGLSLSESNTRSQTSVQQYPVKATFGSFASQNHANRLFQHSSSNQGSPMHSPSISSAYDVSNFSNASIGMPCSSMANPSTSSSASPSQLIRQSQSFSMLSSLNPFSQHSLGHSTPSSVTGLQQMTSKSVVGTPQEEKQFSNLQEFWFGNQLDDVKGGGSIPTWKEDMTNPMTELNVKSCSPWSVTNSQENNFHLPSEFLLEQGTNKKQKKNEPSFNASERVFSSISENTFTSPLNSEPIKVSAANEGDEIVISSGPERRISGTMAHIPSLTTSASNPFFTPPPQQQSQKEKVMVSRLLPISKAAIEPPNASISKSTSSNQNLNQTSLLSDQ